MTARDNAARVGPEGLGGPGQSPGGAERRGALPPEPTPIHVAHLAYAGWLFDYVPNRSLAGGWLRVKAGTIVETLRSTSAIQVRHLARLLATVAPGRARLLAGIILEDLEADRTTRGPSE